MHKSVYDILDENSIDPNAQLTNGSTAFDYLESAILGALDEIDESLEK